MQFNHFTLLRRPQQDFNFFTAKSVCIEVRERGKPFFSKVNLFSFIFQNTTKLNKI